MLGGLGALAGLALAWWASRGFSGLADANLPNVHPAKTMDEAARMVVDLAKGGA